MMFTRTWSIQSSVQVTSSSQKHSKDYDYGDDDDDDGNDNKNNILVFWDVNTVQHGWQIP